MSDEEKNSFRREFGPLIDLLQDYGERAAPLIGSWLREHPREAIEILANLRIARAWDPSQGYLKRFSAADDHDTLASVEGNLGGEYEWYVYAPGQGGGLIESGWCESEEKAQVAADQYMLSLGYKLL